MPFLKNGSNGPALLPDNYSLKLGPLPKACVRSQNHSSGLEPPQLSRLSLRLGFAWP